MSIVANENNNLFNLYPNIAQEWNYEKNAKLTPHMVTAKSGRKVWWICDKGHEWESIISNRTKQNSGCPYCAGKKAIVGVNDLQTVNPTLAAEWHLIKNGIIMPTNVMRSSKNKYWWLCTEGHEWEATLDSRDKRHGCPYCSGRKPVKGKNDLASLRPDIAKLWHPTKNSDVNITEVTVASGRKCWWLGECGHEWETKVATMCDKTTLTLCPICNGQVRTSFPEQAIFYYAQMIFPDVISRYGKQKKEIDVYSAAYKIGFEYDGLLYHTNVEKESKKDAYFAENGITIFHLKEHEDIEQKQIKNTIYYRPWNNYVRLNKAIESLLELAIDFCGLEIELPDIDIERDNSEILTLYIKKKLTDGFAEKHPDMLKEWHPTKNGKLDPYFISEHSNHKFWWLCNECGYEWNARLSDRVNDLTGCPICGKKKQIETYRKNLVAKKGSLLEHFPEIANEWNTERNFPLSVDLVTPGSNKKVYWICKKCGNEWQAVIANRTKKGQGCPKCRSVNCHSHGG